jgi:TRAP-type C4-dicarboxylate transport system permease small subunit
MGNLIVTWINRVSAIIAITAFAVLIAAVPTAVFFRYVLNNSIIWAEELSRYLFVWITFMGAGLGVGKNTHVGVDAVTSKLSPQSQWWTKIWVNIGIMGFSVFFIIYGAKFTAFGMGSRAMVMRIPMAYVYLAVPLGGIVMLVNIVDQTWKLLRETSEEGSR